MMPLKKNIVIFAMLIFFFGTNHFLSASLEIYFPLDTNANDYSSNAFNGFISNTLTQATDRYSDANGAYYFNGSNAYISVPYSPGPAPTNQLSIAVWAYSTNWGTNIFQNIVSKGQSGGYGLGIEKDNGPYFTVYSDGTYHKACYPSTSITDGWHHLAGTFDGQTLRFYFDGSLVSSSNLQSVSPISYSVTNNLIIGADAGSGVAADQAFFKGRIDDVSIYSHSLSAPEISFMYAPTNRTIADFKVNGNTADSSSSALNVTTKTAAVSYTNDRFESNGGALYINNDHAVTVSNNTFLSRSHRGWQSNFALSLWLKPDVAASSTQAYIVGKDGSGNNAGDFAIVYNKSTDRLNVVYGTATIHLSGMMPVSNSGWVHAAVVYDSNRILRLYENGMETTNRFFDYNIWKHEEVFFLSGSSGYSYAGGLDDVRIYNRTLGPGEISNMCAFEAFTLTVTTTNDIISPYDNLRSLSEVLYDATNNAVIDFDPTIFYAGDGHEIIHVKHPALINKGFTINGDTDGDGTPDVVFDGGVSWTDSDANGYTDFGESSGGDLSIVFNGTNTNAVNGVIFQNFQSTSHGGALFAKNGTSLYISNCVFLSNASSQSNWSKGGAVSADTGALLNISNTVFIGNTADEAGGAIWTMNTPVLISRSLFIKNRANGPNQLSGYGDAVSAYTGEATTITHSTFYGQRSNYCTVKGHSGGAINVFNSIIEDTDPGTDGVTYSNSLLTISVTGTNHTNNSTSDPSFQNPGNFAGPDNRWLTADDGLLATNVAARGRGAYYNLPIPGNVPMVSYSFSTNYLDQGGFSFDLAPSNAAPSFTNGYPACENSAVYFTGSEYLYGKTYITEINPTSTMTLSAWIYPEYSNTSGDAWEVVSLSDDVGGNSKTDYFGFRIEKTGRKLQLGVDDGSSWSDVITVSEVPESQWAHVAAVISNGNVTLYINGLPDGTGSFAVINPTTINRLCVGGARFKSGIGETQTEMNYFEGAIDEVKIFDKALSPDNISNIAREGVTNQSGDSNTSLTLYRSNEVLTNFSVLDFTTNNIGDPSVCSFTLSNSGPGQLNINSVEITGANTNDFFISLWPSNTVDPVKTTELLVTFIPEQEGVRSATLTINNSSTNMPVVFIDLTGFGSATNTNQSGDSNTSLALYRSNEVFSNFSFFNFKTNNLYHASRFYLTISNSGNYDIAIEDGKIVGSNKNDFEFAQWSWDPIPPGSVGEFAVDFIPKQEGPRQGILIISNSSTNAPGIYVDLLGFGTNLGNTNAPVNGSGLPGDPYQVASLEHLRWMSTNEMCWHAHFEIISNIDASDTSNWNSGEGFEPIGEYYGKEFSGVIHGGGHTIKGLYINRPSSDRQAFIEAATHMYITNLIFEDAYVRGARYCGIVAGSVRTNYSSGISASGIVTANGDFNGGLFGAVIDPARIERCYFTGLVSNAGSRTGGITSYPVNASGGNWKDIGVRADIYGQNYSGGLFYNTGIHLKNSFFTGTVNSTDSKGTLAAYVDTYKVKSNFYWNYSLETNFGFTNTDYTYNFTPLNTNGLTNAFSYSGFDFTNTWAVDPSGTTNGGMPYLKGLYAPLSIYTLRSSSSNGGSTNDLTNQVPAVSNNTLTLYRSNEVLTNFSVLDFTTNNIGDPSVCSFTLSNSGPGQLNINSVEITGANTNDFFISLWPSNTVDPVKTTELLVTFIPEQEGVRSATLTINNSSTNMPVVFIDLTGFGSATNTNQSGDSNTSLALYRSNEILTNFSVLDFTTNSIGDSSVCSLTISNSGSLELTINAVEIDGSNKNDFVLTQWPTNIVDPLKATELNVNFSPQQEGLRKAVLIISNSSTNMPVVFIGLTGFGSATNTNQSGDSNSDPVLSKPTIENSFTILKDSWNLIGLSTNAVLMPENFIGESTDIWYWSWDNLSGAYTRNQTITRGDAFWVLSENAISKNLQGLTNISDETLSVTLNKGWNLITSPFPIPVNHIEVAYQGSTNIFSNAASVETVLWKWDAAQSGYVQASKLDPWCGHWVRANQNTKLIIDSSKQTSSGNLTAPPLKAMSKLVFSPEEASYNSAKETINAYLSLTSGKSRDIYNAAVLASSAADHKDKLDVSKPPASPSDGVRLFFENDLSIDVRPRGKDVTSWKFFIEHRGTTKPALLHYNFKEMEHAGYKMTISSEDGSVLADNGYGSLFIAPAEKANHSTVPSRRTLYLNAAAPGSHNLLSQEIIIGDLKERILVRNGEETEIVFFDPSLVKCEISILNLKGKKVFEKDISATAEGFIKTTLPTDDFSGGVYIMILKKEDYAGKVTVKKKMLTLYR